MKTSYLKATNTIMARAISMGLHHQDIPAFTKLTKAQDKLELMLKTIRSQISLTIALDPS